MLWIALAIIAMAMTETAVAKPQALKRSADDKHADNFYFMVPGKLYFYHAVGMTFDNARKHCTDRGGDLATINSIAHFKIVNDKIQTAGKELWLGTEFNSTAGFWQWFTGEEFPTYGEGFVWHHPTRRPFSNANGNVGGPDTAMFIHGSTDQSGFCGPAPKSSTTRGALCEIDLEADTSHYVITPEKTFFYHAAGMTFDNAKAYCTERGGDLASFKSIAQFKKVDAGIQGAGYELWLGAEYNSTAGFWHWFTGEKFPIYGEGFVWHHPTQIPFQTQGTDAAGPDMGMFIHGDTTGGNIGRGICGPGPKSSTTRGALCEVVLKY